MRTWWHVHIGPPFKCRGGADGRGLADELRAVTAEDDSSAVVVMSKDHPTTCPYLKPGSAILHGVVEKAKP